MSKATEIITSELAIAKAELRRVIVQREQVEAEAQQRIGQSQQMQQAIEQRIKQYKEALAE